MCQVVGWYSVVKADFAHSLIFDIYFWFYQLCIYTNYTYTEGMFQLHLPEFSQQKLVYFDRGTNCALVPQSLPSDK